MLSKRFIKFAATGLITTSIDFILFYLIHLVAGVAIIPSNIISYGTGIICAFFINKRYTFPDSKIKNNKIIILSLILGYIGLFINTAIVWTASTYMHPMLAKTIAVILVLLYNYLTNKIFIFKIK